MLEDVVEQIDKILYAILASNEGHYANECLHRNLHCEGEPNDDEQYDEHKEMKQADIWPQFEAEQPLEVTDVDESPNLVLHWHLLEDNENQAPIFRTRVSCKGKACNVIIDGGNAMNVISKEAFEKLQLPTKKHPKPYRIAWVDDYSILINWHCIVPLKVGSYEDSVKCDDIPMKVAHILFNRPWLQSLKVITDRSPPIN